MPEIKVTSWLTNGCLSLCVFTMLSSYRDTYSHDGFGPTLLAPLQTGLYKKTIYKYGHLLSHWELQTHI